MIISKGLKCKKTLCIHCILGGLVPVRFKGKATYRMVVWGETAGTVSKFRCIHLTVVRKHKQRLGQLNTNCGPLASRNKAAA